MDIAQVAKRSGVPASTLRYYEEKGLIASVGREGLRRRAEACGPGADVRAGPGHARRGRYDGWRPPPRGSAVGRRADALRLPLDSPSVCAPESQQEQMPA